MTLTEILQNEFLNESYLTQTDEERFDSLTNVPITKKIPIETLTIQKYLALQMKLLPIEASASDTCKMVNRMMQIFDSFSMDETNVETMVTNMLDGLIAESLLNVDDKVAILVMGNKIISRAEQLSISNLTLEAVIAARV